MAGDGSREQDPDVAVGEQGQAGSTGRPREAGLQGEARRWVMLASEQYSFPILRPLAAEAVARGHHVAWIAGDAQAGCLKEEEIRLRRFRDLLRFSPDAVFATVDRIPPWFPGLQVQLFHGLNLHKRDPRLGQFRIQRLYDVYCSHGPATTWPLQALQARHGDFVVVETGWPKLDPLLRGPGPSVPAFQQAAAGRPIVMYASTFNEPLSCARECLATIEDLVDRGDRFWLLTLHPKSPPALIARYRELQGNHAIFLGPEYIADMSHAADVLVCDTTSVVEEFALLGKPVVTMRHRRPLDFMINVDLPEHLDAAIQAALDQPNARRREADTYMETIHPSRDGDAASRVLAAIESILMGSLSPRRTRVRPVWRRAWRAWRMSRDLLPG